MQKRVYIEIYKDGKYITRQDVSCFTLGQVDENIKVKREYGLECRIKVVPDSQGEV